MKIDAVTDPRLRGLKQLEYLNYSIVKNIDAVTDPRLRGLKQNLKGMKILYPSLMQ